MPLKRRQPLKHADPETSSDGIYSVLYGWTIMSNPCISQVGKLRPQEQVGNPASPQEEGRMKQRRYDIQDKAQGTLPPAVPATELVRRQFVTCLSLAFAMYTRS